MSTLFLIGNGFDINCGMKTRYTDVYQKYINQSSKSEVIKNFKENISADFETWGDFEIAMGEYAKELQKEEEFLECIRDFAHYMEGHLVEENNKLKKLLNDKNIFSAVAQEMEQSFRSFYTDISHNIDSTMQQRNATYYADFKAISFNYTDVFDVLWEERVAPYSKNSVIHIHGELQDAPVFGVDNIEQIKANYVFTRRGKRGFIKPIFNSLYDEQRVLSAKKLIKNSWTICAYGMSLGDSDLSWRNEVIEWLKSNKDHHLFVYKYDFSKAKYLTVSEKMDIEDDAKEQLLLEWEIDEKDELFEQIHIPCGKNIFNIEAVLTRELGKSDARKKLEIQKRIVQGEKFIQNNQQKVIVTT